MLNNILAVETVALILGFAYLVHERIAPHNAAQAEQLPQITDNPQRAAVLTGAVVPDPLFSKRNPPAAEIEEVATSSIDPHLPPALRRPRLVITKSAHRLTVYDGDSPIKTYRAAVGKGRGDKVREGDRCTPQGEFVICHKNPHSKYILSLGLSYPNIEDAERGLREGLIGRREHRSIVEAARAARRPPWNTPLGGEIMIHGRRDGRNWTRGCIALDDDDIRELYPALSVGTPVTILP